MVAKQAAARKKSDAPPKGMRLWYGWTDRVCPTCLVLRTQRVSESIADETRDMVLWGTPPPFPVPANDAMYLCAAQNMHACTHKVSGAWDKVPPGTRASPEWREWLVAHVDRAAAEFLSNVSKQADAAWIRANAQQIVDVVAAGDETRLFAISRAIETYETCAVRLGPEEPGYGGYAMLHAIFCALKLRTLSCSQEPVAELGADLGSETALLEFSVAE